MRLLYGLVGTACIVYYLIIGLWARFGQSLGWMWLLLGVVLLTACALYGRVPQGLALCWRGLLLLGVLGTAALLVPVIRGMSAQAPENLDYIIVLGARVEKDGSPSLALQRRLNTALEYLEENPDTTVIASGGQGTDEKISEAECIRSALVAAGVAPERILMEDRSTSTEENMLFSKALMSSPDVPVGLVTNNFHVCRALLHAQRAGLTDAYGVAATYTGPTLLHYMVRETVCLVVGWMKGSL